MNDFDELEAELEVELELALAERDLARAELRRLVARLRVLKSQWEAEACIRKGVYVGTPDKPEEAKVLQECIADLHEVIP